MSEDRLKELLRQRALLAEHLAWLDREIAHARPSGATTSGSTAHDPTPADNLRPLPPASGDVDALFERFQTEEKGQGQLSRQGCWLVFAALMLVGLVGIAALIFIRYR